MSAKLYIFHAEGHPNVKATHKTTLEFTKEKELTLQGDCIIAVNSDFDPEKLKEFVKHNKKVKVKITADDKTEELTAELNPEFQDKTEIVIRLSEYKSERTFAVRATKAAKHLSRELVKELQQNKKIKVQFEAIE